MAFHCQHESMAGDTCGCGWTGKPPQRQPSSRTTLPRYSQRNMNSSKWAPFRTWPFFLRHARSFELYSTLFVVWFVLSDGVAKFLKYLMYVRAITRNWKTLGDGGESICI